MFKDWPFMNKNYHNFSHFHKEFRLITNGVMMLIILLHFQKVKNGISP